MSVIVCCNIFPPESDPEGELRRAYDELGSASDDLERARKEFREAEVAHKAARELCRATGINFRLIEREMDAKP